MPELAQGGEAGLSAAWGLGPCGVKLLLNPFRGRYSVNIDQPWQDGDIEERSIDSPSLIVATIQSGWCIASPGVCQQKARNDHDTAGGQALPCMIKAALDDLGRALQALWDPFPRQRHLSLRQPAVAVSTPGWGPGCRRRCCWDLPC